MNNNEPISPQAIQPFPSQQANGAVGRPYQIHYPESSVSTTPSGIRDWYSNEIFKIVSFFILVCGVLSVTTVAFYNGKLSSDQFIGICSSLLMMTVPSPLQTIKKGKKTIVMQPPVNPV